MELYFLFPNINIPIDVVAYKKDNFKKDIPLVYDILKKGVKVL